MRSLPRKLEGHNLGVATARWAEDQPGRTIGSQAVPELWAELEAQAALPLILLVEADGAELAVVGGDPSGTVLNYRPQGYTATGTGSLHSVGDPAAAERDDWRPAMTAYYLGHHTEFPRWSVVPRDRALGALAEFCDQPTVPPSGILWEPD
jgi:hypothetical protein